MLEIEYVDIDSIKRYKNNAKLHPREQIEQIKKSIQEFGNNDPIAVWHNEIVEGHGRYDALKELGEKEIPIIRLDNLTDEQRKAYTLVHNKLTMNSDFDMETLNLELESIVDIDMTDFGFELFEDETKEKDEGKKGSLQDDFIAPPFSVLDTRQGYWQDRKRLWLEKTGDLSETRDEDFGKIGGSKEDNLLSKINNGTSNFDPVLAEIVYKWFCIPNGKIIDPFGGEQTKGVVAGELGFTYNAVEFRQEQVDLNNEKTKQYKNVSYVCGDSNNIDTLIKDNEYDLCFTSPPYYDLEVYSKDDMSALGTYEEFMQQYENIFKKCYDKMADNSFLVIKVGEIRNKKTGQYRCFVPDNVKIMEKIGFKYYNEIILVNSCGTAPIRARQSMQNRKVVKVHQNVIVFYKGDLDKIKEKYKEIDFDDKLFGEENDG